MSITAIRQTVIFPRLCQDVTVQGDRATEKVSICACLLCAFPALRFAKCSLTVRPVQFRSPLAKIITTSKRKCARSCGVEDVVQGGGRCPKQYLSVLQGCISAHCANIQPHNLAFSVARSPTCAHSLHFWQYCLRYVAFPAAPSFRCRCEATHCQTQQEAC